MRSDRDRRTDSEREIDDFLSQFETPVDELSADVNSYLEAKDTTKIAAVRTFYGEKLSEAADASASDIAEDASAAGKTPDAGSPDGRTASHTFSWVSVGSDEKEDSATETTDDIASDVGHNDISDSSADEAADSVSVDEETPNDADDVKSESPASDNEPSSASQSENTQKTASPAPKDSDKKSQPKNKSGKKKKKKKKKKKSDKKLTGAAIKQALFLKANKAYDPDITDQYVTYKGKKIRNVPYLFSIGKLFRDFVMLGVAMVLCFIIYALGCIALAPHIDPSDIYAAVDTSSMIYDDEGNEIDSVYYTQNRQVVSYDEMPEELINAFIAIEDKTFWKHHGFNWTRMIGAILSSFRGEGRISGTSTITQQLARNVYLPDTKSVRSVQRKIVEMYYASRIEHALSKEQIIEAYLNSIYLGYGCYGVDAAARTYFSKEVKDLDLEESAALAALPQAPEDYALLKIADGTYQVGEDAMIVQRDPDTIVTNDAARARRDLTLGLMKDQGMITEEQYTSAIDQSLNSFINPTINSGNGNYSYYHEYLVDTVIRDLMEQYEMEYGDAEKAVYTQGLQIYSTMDSTAQNVVAEEFKDSSNFPSISALYKTDEDGNLLNNDGDIALYNFDHFFDEDGNFALSSDEVSINSDGSVTIYKDHNLHIYETQVEEGVDYSLEFKNYYVVEDDQLYSIQGGYINVPSTYKSLDSSGNLVISADYFTDYDGDMRKDGDSLIITSDAYSLATKTLQPQGAMVIVEVGTGQVKAMVGGRTFRGQKLLNRALNTRQPGSSIKPLAVYGAALQKSYDLAADGKKWTFIDFNIDNQGAKGWGDYVTVHSSIQDERCHIEGKDWPENVTRSFSGKNTFKTAIQQSINTCAVKLLLQVGSDYSINQLKKFGITTAVDDETQYANDVNPAALGLGAMCQGVEPLEMALAYAAFPGEGQVNTPICYTKVLDRNGDVILEGKSESSEALNEGVAFIMTDVLQSVVKANNYAISEVVTGGKTGTTNDKYDIWFDGFTPSYAASLWIGTDQNVEMSDMSYVAARLWGKIIGQIPKACEGSYPSQPSNVVSKGGEYYTTGTDTGLTTYKSPEDIKKEKEEKAKKEAAARKKWEQQRENHKKWVVDEPAKYETKEIKVIDQEGQKAWTETIEHPAEYKTVTDYEEQPVYDDDGNQTGTEQVPVGSHEELVKEAWTETIKHPAVPEKSHIEKQKVLVSKEKGHWEYEKGWGAGEFSYNN